jgi:hypothetical protein
VKSHFILISSVLILLNLTLAYQKYFSIPKNSVLGDSTINATVDYCPTFVFTPENRIPPTGNNSVQMDLQIRAESVGTTVFQQTVTTNSSGSITICPISSSTLPNEYYDISVKGISHLRRNFLHQRFYEAKKIYNLNTPVLLAGDSNPNNDNYINSLDLSYEIGNIYTSTLRADLNRDGTVNSLDFPTMISHLYQHGDN